VGVVHVSPSYIDDTIAARNDKVVWRAMLAARRDMPFGSRQPGNLCG
jgi:hypothetical protein